MSETQKDFQTRTIKNVQDEGTAIFHDFKRRMSDDKQFHDLDHQAKYEYYMKNNVDFARQYPLVLRNMVSYGMFDIKSVAMYLKKCYSCPIKTDEDFAERQADYVKYLYMNSRARMTTKQLGTIWDDARKSILKELRDSRAKNDAIKKRRTEAAPANIQSRRDRIKWIAKTQIDYNASSASDSSTTPPSSDEKSSSGGASLSES
jgi:hypothetical protein